MVDVTYDLSCRLGRETLFAPECIPGMAVSILQDHYKEVVSFGFLSPGLTLSGCLSGYHRPLFLWQYQCVGRISFLGRFWLHPK